MLLMFSHEQKFTQCWIGITQKVLFKSIYMKIFVRHFQATLRIPVILWIEYVDLVGADCLTVFILIPIHVNANLPCADYLSLFILQISVAFDMNEESLKVSYAVKDSFSICFTCDTCLFNLYYQFTLMG